MGAKLSPTCEEWLCFPRVRFFSKPWADPVLSSERAFLSRAFVFFIQAVCTPEVFFFVWLHPLTPHPSPLLCTSTLFKDRGWGRGAAAAAGGPSALTGRGGSSPGFWDPLRTFRPAPRSGSTCASAKFAFAALGSFGIRAEASLLCKQTQRSSSPDPPFCTYTVTCFCCCP